MKKIIFILLAAVFCLTGCGSNQAANNNDVNNDADNNSSDTQSGDADTQDDTSSLKGYIFEYNGVSVGVDMEAAPIIEQLGEPNKYFEADSCAFQGKDKLYTYSNFEISTYEKDGKDYISTIIFNDDMIETPEGVCLFMTKQDMIDAYGEGFSEEQGLCVYEKDGMKLKFIFENDEIISLEYASTFLE